MGIIKPGIGLPGKGDRYVNFAIHASLLYLAATFFAGKHMESRMFLWATASLTALNIGILIHIFSKGMLNLRVTLLNLIQLAVFFQLHVQIHNVLGTSSYSFSGDAAPLLLDWSRFIALHTLKALDLPDLSDALSITLLTRITHHQSIAAGVALFCMRFMLGIFFLGAIFRGIDLLSQTNWPSKISSRARTCLCYGGLSSAMLMIVIACRGNQGLSGWHSWPVNNLLNLLDFGDALQIFAWQGETNSPIMGGCFRVVVGFWMIGQAYRLYSHVLKEALREKIEALAKIAKSIELPSAIRVEAIRKLQDYGKYAEPAIPTLVGLLANCHKPVRMASVDALKGINHRWARTEAAQKRVPAFLERLEKADKGTRIAAAEALGEFGPHAKAGIPVFLKILADEHEEKKVRDTTEQTLTKVGMAAIPELSAIMGNTYEIEHLREAAARVMTKVANEDEKIREAVVHTLVEMLDSHDEKIQALIGKVLKDIGPDAVPGIINMLKSGTLPRLIVQALEQIGSIAKHVAFSHIIKILSKKPHQKLREKLVDIMEELAFSRETALSRKKRAIDLRQENGDSLLKTVVHLVNVLKDEQTNRRVKAAEALGKIGPPARKAVPHLVKALHDNHAKVRSSAEKALRKIVLPPVPSLSVLVKKLAEGETSDRIDAAIIIGELGPRAKKAIPCLMKALADANQGVRIQVDRALGRIEPLWRQHESLDILIPCFVRGMGGLFDDGFRPDMPGEALKKIGPATVCHLVEARIHFNYDVVNHAAEFLEAHHPEWRESEEVLTAIPCLRKGLENDEWYVRCFAAQVLAELGWRAKGTIPDLLKAMAGTDRNVRKAIKRALADILLRKKT